MFSHVTLSKEQEIPTPEVSGLTCLGDRQHPGRAPNLRLDDNGDLQATSSRALERTHVSKLPSQFKEKRNLHDLRMRN